MFKNCHKRKGVHEIHESLEQPSFWQRNPDKPWIRSIRRRSYSPNSEEPKPAEADDEEMEVERNDWKNSTAGRRKKAFEYWKENPTKAPDNLHWTEWQEFNISDKRNFDVVLLNSGAASIRQKFNSSTQQAEKWVREMWDVMVMTFTCVPWFSNRGTVSLSCTRYPRAVYH